MSVLGIGCPVCGSQSSTKPRPDLEPHPYVECVKCGLYYQPNMTPKVYEAHHEAPGDQMSSADREVNLNLARALWTNHVSKLGRDAYTSLDIGSKYPFLSHCLQKVGPITAVGMDGIDLARDFGGALGVQMIVGNFEDDVSTWNVQNDTMEMLQRKFDLVTLVHCLEHMYTPLHALRKIRSLLKPDGILFVRSPDSGASHIERDFTSGHYDIHPIIWNESSLYEALAQLRDCFVVQETYQMTGQRDWILRAIDRKPLIAAGYITKNEERDLPASLESIRGVVDSVCIRDTGSTDRTFDVAAASDIHMNFATYTEASEKAEDGTWQLWNFSAARNQYVKCLDTTADWVLWMDADDTLTPEAAAVIRRVPYMPYDIHAFRIKTGQDSHVHHRMWRTQRGVKYVGACHEYPCWPSDFRSKEWPHFICHNGDEGSGESSIMRNLRILTREVDREPTPRAIFYLANTHRDAAGLPSNTPLQREEHLQKAIDGYNRYIAAGSNYHDELMFAYIYKARCARLASNGALCVRTVRQALALDPSFAELYMEAAYAEYANKSYWQSISWCIQASHLPFLQRLFAEKNKYTDQPARLATHCFLALKFPEMAVKWGMEVFKYTDDPSWREFLKDFTDVINLCRPGAIGDVLMTGWVLEGLREKYPGKRIIYYTKCPAAAELLDVDEIRDSDQWHRRVPGIDHMLIGYPLQEGYPSVPMAEHLTTYFAKEAGVPARKPTLKVRDIKIMSGPYVTLHAQAGWSPYKNWPIDRWEALVAKLKLPVVLLGAIADPMIAGCVDYRGFYFEQSLAAIKGARLHLGVDSFSNHAAAIFGTPAIILFGSTSPIGSGYSTATNLWLGLPCSPCYKEDPKISRQSRGECTNPKEQTYDRPLHACMHELSVDYVYSRVVEHLAKSDRMNLSNPNQDQA